MSARDLTHYQRNLPHRLPAGNYIFVTFRLAGSLPRQVIEQLQVEWQTIEDESKEEKYARQKRYFGRYDHLLDGAGAGPTWLRKTEIAQIVADAIQHYQAKKAYRLVCYCLMPNHVHMVVDLPEAAPSLSRTLQYLKGYTAQKANALLRRTGQFWHREKLRPCGA